MTVPKCEVCKRTVPTKGSIIGDIYYRHICSTCYSDLMEYEKLSSGEAEYNRGRDAEEHEADYRQPYTDGEIDPEFVRLYPERAKQMWTAEEIDRALRR